MVNRTEKTVNLIATIMLLSLIGYLAMQVTA